jgi:integrase
MSVRKRQWKTRAGETKTAWVVDYAIEGSRHLRTFAKKKEADAFAQQAGVDIRAGTHTPLSRSITVEKAAEQWIIAVELEGREASTLAQYRQHARHINERIGKVKLGALTAKRVNQFRDEILATMSPAMARKIMSSLKSLLKDAMRRGDVAQNVALSAKKIDSNKRAAGRLEVGKDIPTADEIRVIVSNLKGRWRPLLMTAIFTGLRSSELRGLRWSDIDLKASVLHVRQRADRYQQIGSPKSATSHRSVPLGPMVLNVLREWKLKCPVSELGLTFPTDSGQRSKSDRRGRNAGGNIDRHNNILRAFQSTVRRAGLLVPVFDEKGVAKKDASGKPLMAPKYTGLHALRHFYASWCINPRDRGGLGFPPKVVQELLGHSTMAMTMDTYGHLFPRANDADKQLAAAERALLLDAT